MTEQNNKRFSTREWWMLILLIVLFQWLIHFWSTEALSSSAIVDYVSFAGTLVSTILAVLAIIYSFIQSASQQTTSEVISREVHRLQSIVSDVNTSTSKVNESLEKLPQIIEQLENIPSTVSETIHLGVSPLTQSNSKITTMLSQLMSGGDSALVTNKIKQNDQGNIIEESKRRYIIIPALSLALCAYIIVHGKSIKELQSEFMSSVSADSTQIVSELFLSARGALLCLCMQSIFDMDYEDNLTRNSKCSDELWDEMLNIQNKILDVLSGVIEGSGIDEYIPRDIQDKIKSILLEKIS